MTMHRLLIILTALMGIAGCISPAEHRVDKSLFLAKNRDAPTTAPWFLSDGQDGSSEKAKSGGASCTANGAPACGGTCSITCNVGQAAQCLIGRCLPNGSEVCTCESYTSCKCK